jgi:hypothetical protein
MDNLKLRCPWHRKRLWIVEGLYGTDHYRNHVLSIRNMALLCMDNLLMPAQGYEGKESLHPDESNA